MVNRILAKNKQARKTIIFIPLAFLLLFLLTVSLGAQSPGQIQESVSGQWPGTGLRSLEELFPYLDAAQRGEVFSEKGFIRSTRKNEPLILSPAYLSGIDLKTSVMKSQPSYLAESLLVIPYSGRILTRLDAYNALGRIRDLKGRLYDSFTRNTSIPLFEDATRIESAKKTNPINDPPPAASLPISETVFIRLKDVNFGNSYYRGEVSVNSNGVTYNLTNFKTLSYLIFTVMKEEKFSAILYLEPLNEGMLVYSVAGADASDFIASKVHIPSAIEKRLAVFIGWIGDGLKAMR